MKRLNLLAAAIATALTLPAFAVGHMADLRVYDRSVGQDLPVHWHEGRAYVVGRPGNEYQLTVRNTAGEDLLAVVSVDGVNVVSGQTADTKQGGYVISRRDALGIKGWRKSLEHTAAFYFTSLGDSYAARTGRPDHVGVIGVALFRRQREEPPQVFAPEPSAGASPRRDGPPSADSLGSAQKHAERAASPLGTGHGRQEQSQARYVNFQRATDYPTETITIYYDSYRNLVARGILSAPIGRRDPQPFPGFVPDPVSRWPFATHEPGA